MVRINLYTDEVYLIYLVNKGVWILEKSGWGPNNEETRVWNALSNKDYIVATRPNFKDKVMHAPFYIEGKKLVFSNYGKFD